MIDDKRAHLQALLEKYLADQQSDEEYTELAELMLEYKVEELTDLLEELLPDEQFKDAALEKENWQPLLEAILAGKKSLKPSKVRKPFYRLPVFRYVAAAVLLLAIAGGVWYVLHLRSSTNSSLVNSTSSGQSTKPGESVVQSCGLVEPGSKDLAKDKHLITLSIHNGVHTLSISPGWQFHTTLPDGTAVVLNAASSVTYPGSFKGFSKREVEVKGEVFFDVAHNSRKPFFVKVKGVELQALGTSFNVNAYGDKDSVYTTLVSGSLKAVKGKSSALLQPGQQAAIALKDTTPIKVGKANLAQTGMWREGYFSFKQSRVDEVMQELSRWYKWDISFAPTAKSSSFSGVFCRRTSEAEALETLKAGGIQFQKTGNKIVIQ